MNVVVALTIVGVSIAYALLRYVAYSWALACNGVQGLAHRRKVARRIAADFSAEFYVGCDCVCVVAEKPHFSGD